MISFSHLLNCKQIINLGNVGLNHVKRFVTDTRAFKEGDVFIAIPGRKVNPLNLITDLLKRGCFAVFYQFSEENEEIINSYRVNFPGVHFITVKDSITFIQELAHNHIKEWLTVEGNTLFAISGSNGKTTHKEMLSHILEEVIPGQVVSTQKNNNNHLGVPLTLLDVNPKTKFVVLELGSNHPGEIKFLCDLALPNAGITTNIGATHLEFFGTEKEVFAEEGYLYYAVKKNTEGRGLFLINNDDHFLRTLENTEGTQRFGKGEDSELLMSFYQDGAKLADLSIHNAFITGEHNKSNLVTCAYIAHYFYPNLREEILKAASSFRPTANRSQWIEVLGSKIFLDAYNANPSSMRVALDGFKEHILSLGTVMSDSCVILGDMNELGEHSARYHQETGEYASSLGFDHLIFIGRFAQDYLKGAKKGEMFESVAHFKSLYQQNFLANKKYHFIKGSRSLQLESLFDIN